MKAGTKIALGVVGALAAGVAIGLLMAPEKGSDTRKKIKRKAEDLAGQIGGAWSKGKEWMEDVEESSKKIKSAALDKLNKAKENIG